MHAGLSNCWYSTNTFSSLFMFVLVNLGASSFCCAHSQCQGVSEVYGLSMVIWYHSSQTCWDCRWSPIEGSNKSKKVPWKYGTIKFSEKMFRWYIPEMKVHLKRVLVLLAISLNWFVMVQKRWKIQSRATPKAGFEKMWSKSKSPAAPALTRGFNIS